LPNRLELARRLHDGPAQQIFALGLSLDEIIASSELSNETRLRLREIRLNLFELSGSLRDEIYLLRLLDFAGLARALDDILKSCSISIALPRITLRPQIEDGIVRAILEIARNSARHSSCTKFLVTSEIKNNKLSICILDNGKGGIKQVDRSFGLRGIKETIEAIGGSVSWTSDKAGSRYLIELEI
jgi:signal transduction histidine kinase